MAGKQRVKQKVTEGIAFVKATFNNTIITITTLGGDVICSASAGMANFKGSRKGTPYAAQLASEIAARKAKDEFGMKRIQVRVSGPGAGRESAMRTLQNIGLKVLSFTDITPLPHNGCRSRKKRRV